VQLTNFISALLVGSTGAIMVVRLVQGNLPAAFFALLAVETIIFIGLIGLNYLGYTFLSRFLLCWIPPINLMVILNVLLVNGILPETSLYLGFRIFQITFSFFPFLVFNLSERWKFFIGASVPVLLALFFDPVLDLIGIGYSDMGLSEISYYYNNFRTFLSLLVIGVSFIFLKSILEKQDKKNLLLIGELENKNEIISKNADHKIRQANERLNFHINNTPVAVIERDKNFNVFFWNKRAEELFGWTLEEVKC
jgi:PAS domain-containing protein